eukprot:3236520-Prymnesium_polylepis.1
MPVAASAARRSLMRASLWIFCERRARDKGTRVVSGRAQCQASGCMRCHAHARARGRAEPSS